MADIIRDSTFGQFVRHVTKNRVLQYEDEKSGFELPLAIVGRLNRVPVESNAEGIVDANEINLEEGTKGDSSNSSSSGKEQEVLEDNELAVNEMASQNVHPVGSEDGIVLVDWYSADDPENPMNWSLKKRCYVVFAVCIYTVSVYIGSSIYTPGMSQVMDQFNIGHEPAVLGMSLYILGYGMGPLLWSPLAEIPAIGKNPPYVYTYAIFLILTVPTAVTNSFAGLCVSRFLLGFFGSPCLATAGSTFQDLFPLIKIVYPLIIWAIAAHLGPALGPVATAFTVGAKSWRWAGWEMLWLAAPTFMLLFLTMPETSGATILLRRAQRLRKLLGRDDLRSQSEIDQKHMNWRQVAFDALIKPWEINILDPAVLFSTFYTALCYGIFYSFFESVPFVFIDMYHFTLGESSLPFLSTFPFLAICAPGYALYWYLCVEKPFPKKGFGPQEDRLLAGLVGSVIIPVGLFLYAWTASPDIHWIWPTIGLGLNIGGTFLIIQSIFLYLPFTYPPYSASLFAANDLARSTMAAAAIHFARPLFTKLGVSGGVSLLGGLTVLCAGLLLLLYLYGAKLRAKSRFALK